MNIESKNVLITGVTGTLGERVAKSFISKGANVRGLIRNEKDADKFLKYGMNTVVGDLSDVHSIIEATKHVDIVIHCAAYLGDDRENAVLSNVVGVDHLAQSALKAGVKKFIHISSISVYGEPEEGSYDESSPLCDAHNEIYVETKVKSERILYKYLSKGLDVMILRPGAICAEENSYWGDRQIYRMIETETVDWVHTEDVISWVHADNLVEMIHLVLLNGTKGQAYNAIDGNFDEKDFRMKFIKALNKKYKRPNRNIERPIYSNAKIKEIGYVPVKTFADTISNLEKMAISRKSNH
ncbi:NAD-dependent epimerase/dehydratase family protein [Pseudalkalibacillus berkeleyi]|uniref:NAD-dependent epimerase/dehydratase family protein n=1 Tax=Pseudalkalibacillus berkeleyi TaxID=1069813 RepID=A0ABS9H375_9BACL|nr:NAD-dependent epimerase/dehydratase family protein [Pseudalkalibacillus berkeleyi]MCF6138248.1 NAD-dependent epimerase/dehydratase family protein [Pseudalkalibacillus berkeleyi]